MGCDEPSGQHWAGYKSYKVLAPAEYHCDLCSSVWNQITPLPRSTRLDSALQSNVLWLQSICYCYITLYSLLFLLSLRYCYYPSPPLFSLLSLWYPFMGITFPFVIAHDYYLRTATLSTTDWCPTTLSCLPGTNWEWVYIPIRTVFYLWLL